MRLIPVDHNPFLKPAPKPQQHLDVVRLMNDLHQNLLHVVDKHAANTSEQIAKIHKSASETTQELVRAITAPKKILHSEDGRPIGIGPDTSKDK